MPSFIFFAIRAYRDSNPDQPVRSRLSYPLDYRPVRKGSVALYKDCQGINATSNRRSKMYGDGKRIATLDAVVAGIKNGANIVRVHDVTACKKALDQFET